jgi:hypothetical protein
LDVSRWENPQSELPYSGGSKICRRNSPYDYLGHEKVWENGGVLPGILNLIITRKSASNPDRLAAKGVAPVSVGVGFRVGLNTVEKRLNTVEKRLNTVEKRLNTAEKRQIS